MKLIKLLALLTVVATPAAAQDTHTVKSLKITILSTMLANDGFGEWGFSALVEADGRKILFDTGSHPNTVINNATELKIDLTSIPTLILSHNHTDHTTGWIPLREKIGAINKSAFSTTYVAPGFFDTRVESNLELNNGRKKDSAVYVKTGGTIILEKNFTEIFPGVYLTGNVARVYPEKNFSPGLKKKDANGKTIDDNIPEDMSMVIATKDGLVLLSGCGHSGVINTVTAINHSLPATRLLAAIGGFHLLGNTDAQIKWTALELKKQQLRFFMGAHCTGIEPVYQIREWAGLKRDECIVGAVGSTFDLVKGFTAGQLTMGVQKSKKL